MKLSYQKILGLVALLAASSAHADVSVASLFTDYAVLQQGLPVPVWGKADPGEKVSVTYQGQTETATTGTDGRWKITFQPFAPGLSGSLVVAGSNTITLNKVVTGEVWLCSGQSNMGLPVKLALDPEKEIAASLNPMIRLFAVRPAILDQPTDTVIGRWQVCRPKSVPNFSAVGYYFAKNLQPALKIPVGIIASDDGGTLAETWTSTDTLRGNPKLRVVLDRWAKELQLYPERKVAYDAAMAAWKQKVITGGTANPPSPRGRPQPPPGSPGQNDTPGGHFNGMIYPLIPYAIRGAVWYQGESNAPRASEYRDLAGAMITDWRNRWGEGNFPVIIVELPRHLRAIDKTGVSWAFLREAQTQLLALDKTGLAVTLDLGETKNLHPKNKQEVGRRVALVAENLAYGKQVACTGPLFQEAKIQNGAVRITFSHTDQGLVASDGKPLDGFQIAGADKVFVPAEAKIEGDAVIVSSANVSAPVAVRYAWTNDPVTANLANGAGLPASPFRTDSWDN
jgi:sialate O-acetylesterase